MSRYRLYIWDEAEAELLDAVEWYNQERQDLGNELLIEVEQTLERVRLAPGRYQRVEGQLRRDYFGSRPSTRAGGSGETSPKAVGFPPKTGSADLLLGASQRWIWQRGPRQVL